MQYFFTPPYFLTQPNIFCTSFLPFSVTLVINVSTPPYLSANFHQLKFHINFSATPHKYRDWTANQPTLRQPPKIINFTLHYFTQICLIFLNFFQKNLFSYGLVTPLVYAQSLYFPYFSQYCKLVTNK